MQIYDFLKIIIRCFKLFKVEGLIGDLRWLYTMALLIVYGFAHIPQTYLCSLKFKEPSTGFAVLTSWNIVSS